jgi:PAS domain S-box-containing protein
MKKALIVDDLQENLYLVESLLKAYNYKTISARNGAEALGLALADPPDIIIADILMPVMDGYTLCREWKKDENLKNIPFVFYTATYTHPKDGEFAMSLGADKFIIKPQEPEAFIAMIEEVLAEYIGGNHTLHTPPELSETTMLKEYNETLIRKMEDRMLKSEESEKKIRIYAAQLEKEIEQRKLVEQALKESEILFRSVVKYAAEGFAITDATGRIIIWNDAMEKITGLLARDIIGKYAWELQILLMPEKHRTERAVTNLRKEISAFLATGNSPFAGKLFERKYIQPSGTEVYFEERVVAITTDPGFILVATLNEITERKIADRALKESELRFRVLAESAPVGIFQTDMGGLTNYVNPRWCEISQLSFDEAIGFGWHKSIHPEDFENVVGGWQRTIITREVSKTEYRFIHPDGSITWVFGQAVPQNDKDGNFIGYIGTVTDITERKKMEADLIVSKERAEESDRLKSAFLANMSHEIRTPMNGILGFTELLKEPNLSGNEQQFYIQVIEESGSRMLDLMDNIIDISRIESGEIKVSISAYDIKRKFEHLFDFFNVEAEKKGLKLIINHSLAFNESIIRTDVQKLDAILINLIKNAIKFTRDGFVEFGCEKQDGQFKFFVKDCGVGIERENLDIIFERFRQASESLSRPYEGAGLGLSISKAYVEILGGKIWAESELGKGSVFYFTLPDNAQIAEEIPVLGNIVAEDKPQLPMNLKLMIVDDNDISLDYLGIICAMFCKETIKARTGAEAVEKLRDNPDVNLILMDMKMPVMDGYEATRQIRQFNKEVIIIAQTAFTLVGDKEKAMEAGCNDYIAKPLNKEKLEALIQFHTKK